MRKNHFILALAGLLAASFPLAAQDNYEIQVHFARRRSSCSCEIAEINNLQVPSFRYVRDRLQQSLAVGRRPQEIGCLVLCRFGSFGDNDLDLAVLELVLERVEKALIELVSAQLVDRVHGDLLGRPGDMRSSHQA
jgi:hypothetical protein